MCSNVATNLTNENQDLNKESKNCIHLIKEKKLYKMYLKINSQIKTKQQIIFIEKKFVLLLVNMEKNFTLNTHEYYKRTLKNCDTKDLRGFSS